MQEYLGIVFWQFLYNIFESGKCRNGGTSSNVVAIIYSPSQVRLKHTGRIVFFKYHIQYYGFIVRIFYVQWFIFQSPLKSVQVMVRLHIFPIFSFLANILCRKDNIFASNENIGIFIVTYECMPSRNNRWKVLEKTP